LDPRTRPVHLRLQMLDAAEVRAVQASWGKS